MKFIQLIVAAVMVGFSSAFFAPVPGKTTVRPVGARRVVSPVRMSADLFEKVQVIVSEQLGVKLEDVRPESSFVDDLGADSLDTVELIMSLEEAFNTEIPEEHAQELVLVQDAVDFIEKRPE